MKKLELLILIVTLMGCSKGTSELAHKNKILNNDYWSYIKNERQLPKSS